MSLNDTPRASRLHIGIFGKRNTGKSSLINSLTGHQIALVSEVAGTTADPVFKTMEIHGIGPVVFIDTAGFDDKGELGALRVEKTKNALDKTDIALVVFSGPPDVEIEWIEVMKAKKTPVVTILNKADILESPLDLAKEIEDACGIYPVIVSAVEKKGIKEITQAIIKRLPEDFEMKSITGDLAKEGDLVLLVMPQDIQAPKGRLILPQMQTLRDLLDKKCLIMSCTTDKLKDTLEALSRPPHLIITDSQVFKTVYEMKPEESLLTSFSVLYAGYKGDIKAYVEGAAAIDSLTPESRVLIAEACTHAPLAEDIGREKIPRMLKKKVGEGLKVDVVSGQDFPEDLTPYDLIIQCGACMFNRKYVLSRLAKASAQGVPMSNYGVVIAHMNNMLDKVVFA